MPRNDLFSLSSSSIASKKEDIVDLRQIILLMLSKWYLFLLTLIVALIGAFFFIKFSNPVYRVSATLLIDEGKSTASSENNQMLQGFGLGASLQNLDNQIMVLSSKTLIGRTLDELPFYSDFYITKFRRKVSLYPQSPPIKIVQVPTDYLPKNLEFSIENLGNNMYRLESEPNESFEVNTRASFGDTINTPGGKMCITMTAPIWPAESIGNEIKFIFHDKKTLVEEYRKRILVEKISRTGSIVEISLEGSNQYKNIEFLNKLCDIFLNNSLEKKNEEAIRIIQFIDDQLIGISDSLVLTENKLQQFRSQHKVMNLSAQGQVIIDQAMNLENQRARLGVEANYYNYLADYLAKDNSGQAPIAPATIGITDPGLTKLVTDLADIQGQYYSKSLGEKNPLQSQLAQRLQNTKESLRETLNGVRRSNNLAMTELTEQIRTINAQAAALPVTERQLLGIERKYKLNDELYTFLLEKRAEAQIQKASNMPDNELVDPPEADIEPVKPRKSLIYLFAIALGICFPFLWVLFIDSDNKNIRYEKDIKSITNVPIVAHIPHSAERINVLDSAESNNEISEAFRSLRSKLLFINKGIKSPVMLITSSMPKEGKTFTAINLSRFFSLMGKKTILVDFNLRKPVIHSYFNVINNAGVSSWLTGINNLEEVIIESKVRNLYIIPGGPVQPNPSELLALEKSDELFKLLKEKFDFIIIDSAPIGAVSDSFHLATISDSGILVVRQNLTHKAILQDTLNELSSSGINQPGIVVNDIVPSYKRFKYT